MSSIFHRVEVEGRIVDVRVAGGVIREVSPGLRPGPAETVVDGHGGALGPVNLISECYSHARLTRLVDILRKVGADPVVTSEKRIDPALDFAWAAGCDQPGGLRRGAASGRRGRYPGGVAARRGLRGGRRRAA